jgi:uncharacterized protein involved in exopolysaccharide biosynthesis
MGTDANLKTGVISVGVVADDPQLAQQIAQQMLEELNRFNLSTRRSQATAERQFTERRLADEAETLRAAENALESFVESNRDLRAPRVALEQERLTRAVTLRRQLYTTLAANLEQAKLDEVRDTPVLTVIEAPVAPARPDKRGVGYKVLGGMVGGALLGLFIVFANVFFSRARERSGPTFEEFNRLRSDTLDELLHPWRVVGRPRSRDRAAH